MITVLGCMLSAMLAFFKPRCDLAAQVLTLRHQLAVLQQERRTPRLNRWDRILWVSLQGVAIMDHSAGHRPTRHCHPLVSVGLQNLLAVEVSTLPTRSSQG